MSALEDSKILLNTICESAFKEKSLDVKYRKRLDRELREIDNQSEYDYFLDLHRRNIKFPSNEHNILIAYLLGLAPNFDINKESNFTYGEFPDIDVDFVKSVQKHLKDDWAKKEFGVNNVCSIGNYTTFGIKSALLDSCNIYGFDKKELNALTVKLEAKDDEGDVLGWDKAMELYPELKAWCDAHPEVTDTAFRLLNRNRGMGKHAGGLIISKDRIDNLVPLVRSKSDETGDSFLSAFVEGLHGTDLGPLGLIKFDVLVVNDLMRIATISKLIKERHNLKSICALPGKKDWSDLFYLNDPKCLNMADQGDLKGIFQFDSDGIRKLVKSGGVTRFDDLAAYSALYRPGPMGLKMDQAYVNRKNGKEKYEIHPVLEPYLHYTYGVMAYQEQVMQILHAVGLIPLTHCEKIRKAISKKEVKKFTPYKDAFVANGQKVLSQTKEEVLHLWSQIESFADYGFNKSHSYSYAYISARLLWQKCYYPIEFYDGTLMCESDSAKIKEYKLEAEKHNVKLSKVDINRSNWNFNIVDDSIYMGFSNIKGIGEEAAKKIVENQPYHSFEDFLNKFGTNAVVVKPLVGLGLFEGDRVTLYEYYEYYKKEIKKRLEKEIRVAKNVQGITDALRFILPQNKKNIVEKTMKDWATLDENEFFEKCELSKLTHVIEEDVGTSESESPATMAWKYIKKYKKIIEASKSKKDEAIIKLADFKPTGEIDPKLKEIYTDLPTVAEKVFYGFSWDHVLEYSEDYDGNRTFDSFEDDTKLTLLCEVQVIAKAEQRTSKKGNSYYVIKVEDANGRQNSVTFWEEDYKRFEEELNFWDDERKSGHLLKIRLDRPSPGFGGYTFDSPPKHRRHKEVAKEKKDDHRLKVMKWPEKNNK